MPKNTAVATAWRVAAPAPPAIKQRHEPEDEGKRGHHHRAEPGPRPTQRRFGDGEPVAPRLHRELDDQDRVLGGECYQDDDADLGEHVVRQPGQQQPAERTRQPDRDRDDHRRRHRPGFVEPDQHQIGEQHGERRGSSWSGRRRSFPGRRCRSTNSRSPAAGSPSTPAPSPPAPDPRNNPAPAAPGSPQRADC